METLARRTITASGTDVLVKVVATGNGPALRVDGCPMVPMRSLAEIHRVLSRLGRADIEGEGLSEPGERLAAILGELV